MGKAQSPSPPGGLVGKEGLERMLEGGFGKPGPPIGHDDLEIIAQLVRFQDDTCIDACTQCVLDQLNQDDLHEIGIDHRQRQALPG